jgi:hypothetical protein
VPERGSRYALAAEATSAGLLFLLGPAAGYVLGKWLGEAIGLGRVPAWIGAALGLVYAFLHLVRLTGRASH